MNMREIQKIQQKIMKMQEELEQTKFSGSAGGNLLACQPRLMRHSEFPLLARCDERISRGLSHFRAP